MNPTMKSDALPSLTADILSDPHMPADNQLARLWKVMAIPTLLSRAGIGKRSGLPAPNVVYLLLLWGWLKVSSISMFSRDSLQSFADARKDVIYDFLKREDLNWRGFHTQVARRVYQDHNLKECRIKAFVVDDSVKSRRGKKMGGVSRHFDHLTGRTVKGQQVIMLGLATESTFLPLDQDIFISTKQIQPQPFDDNRSVAARRYKQSLEMSKPELLALALKRALRNGFEADYFLADAWFGNKPTIRLTEECDLTAIVRMKKDKTKYRLTTFKDGGMQQEMLTAIELHKKVVRKQWDKIPGTAYQAKTINVELNLAEKASDPDQFLSVRLQFVRGAAGDEKSHPGKHDWALFLSTDSELTPQQMLEIYALRWGIEVYFKEAKQHLGLLKEQTITYTSHIASISLTAIRYLMLLYTALEQGKRLSEVRNEMSDGLVNLSFGQRLWGLFRCLINDTIEQFRIKLGDMADEIMNAIEQRINTFFVQALQLDSFTMELEALPDEA
jgi:SRSO17 transposase